MSSSTSTDAPSAEASGVGPRAGGWLAVGSVAAGTFLLVTTEFLPIGLLSPLAASLGVTEGMAGLAVTAPGLVAMIAAPLLSVLAGSLDRRFIIVALTASIVASNLVVAVAPNFALFLVGRLILGIGVGGLWSFAVAVGRRLVPIDSGARATSVISAGISAGTVFGLPVGAILGDWASWRTVFAANAAMGLLILLMQLRLLPRLAVATTIDIGRLAAFARVPMARVGLVASILVAGGHFVAYTFLEPYLHAVLGLCRTGVALALAGYAVSGIVGTFLGEHLAVRGIRRAFAVASALLGLSVLAAVAAVGSPLGAIAMVMLWGAAFGAVPVCVQIWMFTASPSLYEAGSALMVSAFQIALAAGAAIGGVLVDSSGIGAAFVASGVVSIAGAAVSLTLRAPLARRDSSKHCMGEVP